MLRPLSLRGAEEGHPCDIFVTQDFGGFDDACVVTFDENNVPPEGPGAVPKIFQEPHATSPCIVTTFHELSTIRRSDDGDLR